MLFVTGTGTTPQIVGGGTLILGSTATPDGYVTVQQGLTATIAVNNFTANNLTIAGGGSLSLPLANPNLTSTGDGCDRPGRGGQLDQWEDRADDADDRLALSLGNATLKLINGTFLTTIGTSATLPNGLVLTNPLSFFNSNVTSARSASRSRSTVPSHSEGRTSS